MFKVQGAWQEILRCTFEERSISSAILAFSFLFLHVELQMRFCSLQPSQLDDLDAELARHAPEEAKHG